MRIRVNAKSFQVDCAFPNCRRGLYAKSVFIDIVCGIGTSAASHRMFRSVRRGAPSFVVTKIRPCRNMAPIELQVTPLPKRNLVLLLVILGPPACPPHINHLRIYVLPTKVLAGPLSMPISATFCGGSDFRSTNPPSPNKMPSHV